MIARKQIDIRWSDLLYGLGACAKVVPRENGDQHPLTTRSDAIVCLSVRSGLDLLLTELAWPAGSEILMGAITIPDIPRIVRAHGLVPVPIDIDPDTLQLDQAMLEQACTFRSRAVLVTHLFGSRIDTEPVLTWAIGRGLMLWEDCAQAFSGDSFDGNAQSHVRMFSFGPIKTATALGGGVLLIRDAAFLSRLRKRHAAWPVQSTSSYAGRVLKIAFFKPLLRPRPYAVLITMLRLLGRDHDKTITRLGRSFARGDFFARLRHQPCSALVRLLRRRLSTYDCSRVAQRAAAGERLRSMLRSCGPLGVSATGRSHWLFPVRVPSPETRKRDLWAAGFDATCSESSLYALPPTGGQRPAIRASQAMRETLYVPLEPGMPVSTLTRLAECLNTTQNHASQRVVVAREAGGTALAPQ